MPDENLKSWPCSVAATARQTAVDEWLHKPRHEAADKFGMAFHHRYPGYDARFFDILIRI